jgi:hypothetical protein
LRDSCNVRIWPYKTIPELLLRAAPHKSRERVYELDQIADDMCLLVIRLPSYHCQFYPLQLIWAEVKGKVAQLKIFRLSNVERLGNEATDSHQWRLDFVLQCRGFGCFVLIYQDNVSSYHSFESKNKATLHMFALNFLLNFDDDHVDGLRLRLWAAVTNWPTVHPPGDTWTWRTMVEWYRQGKTTTDSSTRANWQSYLQSHPVVNQGEPGEGN